MQEQCSFQLILNAKLFFIPSQFPHLRNIDKNILSSLITKGEYEIKSNVRESTLEKFIQYWVNNEIPDFRSDNINEYDQLSREFDCMSQIIQIFQKRRTNKINSELLIKQESLKTKFQSKSETLSHKKQAYQRIISILFDNRGINSHENFVSLKSELFDACKDGNVKFVDLISREKVEKDGLTFVLNENNQTAGVFNMHSSYEYVFIPRSIVHHSKEYLITIIFENAFKENVNLRSIQFSEDSELRTIEKNSFPYWLESITIPPSVVELKEGWCNRMGNLNDVRIMPGNRYFVNFEDKFVLGKLNPKSDNYDILLFAARQIETAFIPSYIKRISPFAFEFCLELKNVEFSENSELKIIDENAFSNSSLESILIPSHVSLIAKDAFYFCEKLKRVEFQENSQLLLIDKNAFVRSSLEGITIPSSVVELKEGWCNRTGNLINVRIMPNNQFFSYLDDKFIIGKSDPENDSYDVLLFARRDIQKAIIPSFIKRIASCAFDQCTQLHDVIFTDNSELRIIDRHSFSHTSIENILIPSNVTSIGKGAFYSCIQLKRVEFPDDSNLLSIGDEVFMGSLIESFSIPANLVELKEGWCWATPTLTNIFLNPNNCNFRYYNNQFIIGKNDPKSDIFDVLLFARRDIQKAVIPSFIKRIAPFAFNDCTSLSIVEFEPESQLEVIDESAFLGSTLERITIPKKVTKILKSAFSDNQNLSQIDFADDCQLQMIDEEAFCITKIGSFTIPIHVNEIGKRAFDLCESLQIVQIPENSELPPLTDEEMSLFFYNAIVMMPDKRRKLLFFNNKVDI